MNKTMGEYNMVVEFGEFKGNKLIILKRDDDDNFPFQFGLGKAKLIIANIDEIQKFVNDNQEIEKEEA